MVRSMTKLTHREVAPAIHYWGTPVVLISTRNADGSVNVSPMSSAWWLGWSCMLGLDASSHTVTNLKRERECVLNLASDQETDVVNALALTTGAATLPVHKRLLGYRSEPDKLGAARLDTLPSLAVAPPRLARCAVHLEAEVVAIRPFAGGDPRMAIPACAVEVRILRTHVDERLLKAPDRIDPDRWKPLIMSFRELLTVGGRAATSRLASGSESAYAPWKGGLARRAAARALGAMARYRYGIDDEGGVTDDAE